MIGSDRLNNSAHMLQTIVTRDRAVPGPEIGRVDWNVVAPDPILGHMVHIRVSTPALSIWPISTRFGKLAISDNELHAVHDSKTLPDAKPRLNVVNANVLNNVKDGQLEHTNVKLPDPPIEIVARFAKSPKN